MNNPTSPVSSPEATQIHPLYSASDGHYDHPGTGDPAGQQAGKQASEQTSGGQADVEVCPFCGKLAGLQHSPRIFRDGIGDGDGYRYECLYCAARTCWWHTNQQAKEAWNKRTQLAETRGIAGELAEALKAYMFVEQTNGGVNPHASGTNRHRAFELGRAALARAKAAGIASSPTEPPQAALPPSK